MRTLSNSSFRLGIFRWYQMYLLDELLVLGTIQLTYDLWASRSLRPAAPASSLCPLSLPATYAACRAPPFRDLAPWYVPRADGGWWAEKG